MVNEVSNLYNSQSRKVKLAKQDKFQAMLQEGNPKSLLIKLADRLHNMRTIEGHSPAKRRSVAQETKDFFIPIAQKLGHKALEEELHTLCKPYLVD